MYDDSVHVAISQNVFQLDLSLEPVYPPTRKRFMTLSSHHTGAKINIAWFIHLFLQTQKKKNQTNLKGWIFVMHDRVERMTCHQL